MFSGGHFVKCLIAGVDDIFVVCLKLPKNITVGSKCSGHKSVRAMVLLWSTLLVDCEHYLIGMHDGYL